MRTTLSLDEDVLAAARELSRLDGKSLGEVVSSLARRGLRPLGQSFELRDGFPVFVVSPDLPAMTSDLVRAALDDE